MASLNVPLWALVVGLGLQVGAGIYEARVIVPLWASNPPASVIEFFAQPMRPDSGGRFWIFLTPIVGLISLGNLVFAWSSTGPGRSSWLFAAGASFAITVVTFAYFVPAILLLPKADKLPADVVTSKVQWWVRLNWVRAIVLAAAWLAALNAFAYGR